MHTPDKHEVVSMVLALEEVASAGSTLGVRGLQFMCKNAAQIIRRLRPDLAFVEENEQSR